MEINNPLYKKQGVHVITSIFTVDKGITKVLLIRRKNNPYKDMWSLVGGALYNNEDLEVGVRREIKEKTGIDNIEIYLSGVFGNVNRSPLMRMLAITYIGIMDINKVNILKENFKISDSDWVPLNLVPNLAYDHNAILDDAIKVLQDKIVTTDILKSLFPNGFTIPEIQKTYEIILDRKFDRRNFRKKLLNMDLIEDTNKYSKFEGRKPAKLYKFKEHKENKNVF